MDCNGIRGLVASAIMFIGNGQLDAAKPMMEAFNEECKAIDAELEKFTELQKAYDEMRDEEPGGR